MEFVDYEDKNLNIVKAEKNKQKGDILFNDKNFFEAALYYVDALDLYNKEQYEVEFAYIYNKLGACKANTFQYLEALSYYHKAYYYSSTNKDSETFKKSVYNLAWCYKKLDRYDECIKYLDEYLDLIDKSDNFVNYAYAQILIANCYESKKEYDEVVKIYNSLITECENKNKNLLGYIYNNLGELYIYLNDLDKSIKYYSLAEELRRDKNPNDLAYTYLGKAKALMKLENYYGALELIYDGLSLLKDNPNEEIHIKASYTLSEIYSSMNDKKNLKRIYLNLIELLRKANRKEELIKIYAKSALLYLDEDDKNNCEKYIKYIEELY
ncbi:tetratricopeptide repeat protein [Clostridiales bacterium oral taxon 876 str. F0540]|nr:tetratricopeptide repeat protein [Clostridiales bacterium oral taxon 876 str. F0540]